jgi:hypothetical protein
VQDLILQAVGLLCNISFLLIPRRFPFINNIELAHLLGFVACCGSIIIESGSKFQAFSESRFSTNKVGKTNFYQKLAIYLLSFSTPGSPLLFPFSIKSYLELGRNSDLPVAK